MPSVSITLSLSDSVGSHGRSACSSSQSSEIRRRVSTVCEAIGSWRMSSALSVR